MPATCPACAEPFEPRRRDQRYCSRPCQKAATHNATRGPRTTEASPAQRYEKRRKRALLVWLNTTYYETPPAQRLGLLKGWLDAAREAPGLLREVLITPAFARPEKDYRHSASFRGSWAYPPVPYLADKFCQKFRDCRSWEWVSGEADAPETGEVIVNEMPEAA